MSVALVVLLVAALAGVGAFALSASRAIAVDPIDPAVEERAVARWIARRPRLARFLRERFDRQTRGGFLLTLSFLVLGVVGLVVGVVLDMVDAGSGLARWDEGVAEWGADHASSSAVDLVETVTHLGSTLVVGIVLALVAAVDYVRRRNAEVFVFVAVVGVGELLLNNLLKFIVDRERPAVLQLVEAAGSSFPSGHSAAAAACWSAVALVLGRDRARWTRGALAAGAAVIAIAVATSRALLGVHWVTDVVAGLFVGWGWFVLVAVAFGGRAQRLGDPVSVRPAGLADDPDDPAAVSPPGRRS